MAVDAGGGRGGGSSIGNLHKEAVSKYPNVRGIRDTF